MNNELSQKLEVQTQRLELLTAQSMAGEHIPTRQPDSLDMPDNTPYADEGDEVLSCFPFVLMHIASASHIYYIFQHIQTIFLGYFIFNI